ncbi:MAG: phosphoglycerate kinase [Parcubacteria group bacterium]|jgi:phosphoglycerate kinase
MNIKKIQDADVQGKNVIVRVDFNISIDDTKDVKSSYKLRAAQETIEHLLRSGATHVALLTHFGRPDAKDDPDNSVQNIADDAERILGRKIVFVSDCIGEKVVDALTATDPGTILLLENVRFYAEEETDDASFASALCAPFDIYVNEAFAVSHRKHASVHAITRCLDAYAGLWLQKELDNLEKVKNDPQHPAVAIIGGAKIETKIPVINELAKKYDKVLVGGRTAVEAQEQKLVLGDNVIFPVDFMDQFYDIGPQTIERFCQEIATARTIVWNGPMGKIEDDEYKKGTLALIEQITANTEAYSLIGGGESVQMAEESGLIEKFSFVSTGGGATLVYLGGEEMPGIDVLMK